MTDDTIDDDFVIVAVGDHEVTMTSAEAAALTDAKRAELASECAGVEASITVELRARASTAASAREAAEGGTPADDVVRVWCGQCGRTSDLSTTLATVRRFPAGYVFDSTSPIKTMDLDHEAALMARQMEAKRRAGQRIPFIGLRGRVQVFLDAPPTRDADWPPRVGCALHGDVTIDPAQLLQLARSSGPGRPAKLVVHPRK